MSQAVVALIACLLFSGSGSRAVAAEKQTQAAYDEHWPMKAVPPGLVSRAMSAQSGNASFIINGRPVRYEFTRSELTPSILERAFDGDILQIADVVRDISTNCRLVELLLRRALSVADRHAAEEPLDVVRALMCLGAFYYQLENYESSKSMFQQALARVKGINGEQGLDVANTQDNLALVHRALYDFDEAEKLYRQSLAIRQAVLPPEHPDIAASYWNLAMLCSDSGKGDSEDMLAKAHEIMGDRAFISARRTPGRRPISLNMPLGGGLRSDLPDLVAVAQEIVFKHPPPALPQHHVASQTLPQDPARAPVKAPGGVAEIVGTWTVPTDHVTFARTRTRKYAQAGNSGPEEVEETKQEDGISPYENAAIYLVDATNASRILEQISIYGQRCGLDRTTFQVAWPTTRQQAVEIKTMMDAVAQSQARGMARTDRFGEYRLVSVPKGKYVLYASLATDHDVLFWLSDLICIEKQKVVAYDFCIDNAVSIWARPTNGTRASRR
jgi:tetratricopeptide (TPR) repeat protein